MYLNDRNAIRFWEIESQHDGYFTRWGFHNTDGDVSEQFHSVLGGKQKRSRDEQIEFEIRAKIKKKIESGYKTSVGEAKDTKGRGNNILNLPRPMLATAFDKIKYSPTKHYYMQPKLDGHRCLYDFNSGIAYSRNGKIIDSIEDILNTLSYVLPNEHPHDFVLDGELYYHGWPLQKIISCVKKKQIDTDKIQYWIFDCMTNEPQLTFKERLVILREFFTFHLNSVKINLLRTDTVASNYLELTKTHLKEGYEGSILRDASAPYECGKRSKSVAKIKTFLDDEFIIRGVSEDKNGAAVFHCYTASGNSFSISAPGSHCDKRKAYEQRDNLIGKRINVKYAYLTPDGRPFHPIAQYIREHD